MQIAHACTVVHAVVTAGTTNASLTTDAGNGESRSDVRTGSEAAAATQPVITATANKGGTITPSGKVSVPTGGTQTFTITPAEGYHLVRVKVDGKPEGTITERVFDNVGKNHTISAQFAINEYPVSVSNNYVVKISPNLKKVKHGTKNLTFRIKPRKGTEVNDVTVNGVSRGALKQLVIDTVTGPLTVKAVVTNIGIYPTAIKILPNQSTLPVGLHSQFTAIGKYTNRGQVDITEKMEWSSSDPSVAAISKFDDDVKVYSVAKGTATITARLGVLSASATVEATDPVLQNIGIWPGTLPMAIGAEQRVYVKGTYSDGSEKELSDIADWTISDPAVATLKKYDSDGITYVNTHKEGVTNFKASYGGKEAAMDVYVLPVQTLVLRTGGTSRLRLGIDGSGNITAAAPSEKGLRLLRYEKEKGWFDVTGGVDTTTLTLSYNFNLSIGENGHGLLVISDSNGSYYSSYNQQDGWQPIQFAFPQISYHRPIQVAVDPSGNGLAVWNELTTLYASRYLASSGWSSPIVLAESGYEVPSPVLQMNRHGDAVVVWERMFPTEMSGYSTYAIMFDHLSGWQQPIQLYSSKFYSAPSASIDNSGMVVVGWTTGPDAFQACSTIYLPNEGWQPIQQFNAAVYPEHAKVATDGLGNAMVTWIDGYDTLVYAKYYKKGEGWRDEVVLREATMGWSDPINPVLKMDAQGRALAMWQVDGHFEIKRFDPATGWKEKLFLAGLKSAGITVFDVAMNSAGEAVALWNEGYMLWNEEHKWYEGWDDIYVAPVPDN